MYYERNAIVKKLPNCSSIAIVAVNKHISVAITTATTAAAITRTHKYVCNLNLKFLKLKFVCRNIYIVPLFLLFSIGGSLIHHLERFYFVIT